MDTKTAVNTDKLAESLMRSFMMSVGIQIETELIEDVVKEVATKLGTTPVPVVEVPPSVMSLFAVSDQGEIVFGSGITTMFSPEMAEAAIVHEYSHILSGDYKDVNMTHEMRVECERRADAFTVEHGYGPAFIKMMEYLRDIHHPDGDYEKGHENDAHGSEQARIMILTSLLAQNSTDEA